MPPSMRGCFLRGRAPKSLYTLRLPIANRCDRLALTLTVSCVVATGSRHQSTDQFHRYLHNPRIVQPDGIDSLPRTKAEQQQWLNTEQWDGYSDVYLRRHMQYAATVEHPNKYFTPRHPMLYECLRIVYELYGSLADELQTLHDNPLHPEFLTRIARIKEDREKIAKELDKCYAGLHPTVKTVYDAYLVRRYYHLGDWITHVERKRAKLFEDLSPAYVDHLKKAIGTSEHFIHRLKLMESAFYHTPMLGVLSSEELSQYSSTELAILHQKAAYFRKMRHFGMNQQDSDVRTH